MAIYVKVFKINSDDKDFAFYTYQFSVAGEEYISASGKKRYRRKDVSGKLKIDKRNGDIYIVNLAENDNGSYAKCASIVLIRYWKKGEYPDKAYFES